MKKKSAIALIAIVAIFAVMIFAGCVEKEAPVSTPTASTPVPKISTPIPTPTPTPTPSAYILITEEDSVLSHYISTEYGLRDADSGYTFLILNYTIENHGYDSFKMYLSDFYIIVNNVKYDYDASTFSIIGGLRSGVELLDGGSTSGKVVFEIPETKHVKYRDGYETRYYNIKLKQAVPT